MGQLNDDTLRWNLEVNGNQAQKALGDLDQETKKLEQSNKYLRLEMQKLKAEGQNNTDQYVALSKQVMINNTAITTNRDKMADLRKEIGLNGLTAKQLRESLNTLKRQLDNTTPGTKDWKNLNKELNTVKGRLDDVSSGAKKTNGIFGQLKDLLPAMGVAALAGGLVTLVKNVFNVRAEFEKYEAVLRNSLGSASAARIEMRNLQQFAAETPFQLTELTASYVKLVNQGFKPTTDEMRKLGDVASAQGKSFDQLTEALIDAQTGEFERLKEFGVRAEKNGDKVKFTFKGVKTEVDFTNESIRNYVLGLGDVEGVSGSMAAISETLTGRVSNLGDAWDQMLNNMGQNSTGIMAGVIDYMKSVVDIFGEAAKGIQQIKQEVADDTLKEAMIQDEAELNTLAKGYLEIGLAVDEQAAKSRAATTLINQYKTVLLSLTSDEEDRKKVLLGQIDALENYATKNTEAGTAVKELSKTELKAIDDAEKKRKETEKKGEELKKRLLDLQREFEVSGMNAHDKELAKITDKYTKEIDAAKGYNTIIVELTKLREQEIAAFEMEWQQRVNEEKFQLLIENNQIVNEEEQLNQLELLNKGLITQEQYDQLDKEREISHLATMREIYNRHLSEIELDTSLSDSQREKAKKELTGKILEIDTDLAKAQADIGNATEKTMNEYDKRRLAAANSAAASLGTIIGDIFSNTERSSRDSMKSLLKLAPQTLRQMAYIYIAQATALEVGTKGYMGLGTAAALTVAIEAAIAVATNAVESGGGQRGPVKVEQMADGHYDVVGAQDNRLYRGVSYSGLVTDSKIQRGPTLISERGDEMILTGNHTRNIVQNYPALYNAIMATRVPQRADGSVPAISTTSADPQLAALIAQNTATLNALTNKLSNLSAKLNYDQFKQEITLLDSVIEEQRM